MTSINKALALWILTVFASSAATAAVKTSSAPAPVPAQILSAKRIFIANAGGDQMAENDPIFSGGPDRAYSQFYAALKNWGRFEIVGSPAEADLLLEIRQEVQTVSLGGKAGSSYTPLFHLIVLDPKSNALLWGYHIHSQFGLGQASSDRVFDQAIEQLVADLQALVGQTPNAAGAAGAP